MDQNTNTQIADQTANTEAENPQKAFRAQIDAALDFVRAAWGISREADANKNGGQGTSQYEFKLMSLVLTVWQMLMQSNNNGKPLVSNGNGGVRQATDREIGRALATDLGSEESRSTLEDFYQKLVKFCESMAVLGSDKNNSVTLPGTQYPIDIVLKAADLRFSKTDRNATIINALGGVAKLPKPRNNG